MKNNGAQAQDHLWDTGPQMAVELEVKWQVFTEVLHIEYISVATIMVVI